MHSYHEDVRGGQQGSAGPSQYIKSPGNPRQTQHGMLKNGPTRVVASLLRDKAGMGGLSCRELGRKRQNPLVGPGMKN